MGFRGNSKEKEKNNNKNDIKALLWDSQSSSTLILKIKIKLKDCHNCLLASFWTVRPDCPPPAPHFWLHFWPSQRQLACRGWDAKGVLSSRFISQSQKLLSSSIAKKKPPKAFRRSLQRGRSLGFGKVYPQGARTVVPSLQTPGDNFWRILK